MSVETELKLRIAPEHMNRLRRHPIFKKLAVSRAYTRKVYSVYYDTPALELHQRAMALRLRHVGKQWLQTLKGGGGVQAGLHQRNEWETPLTGEVLDFEALEAIGGMPLSPDLRKKLRPTFVTDFSRTIRMLNFNGAEIELSFDSGEIRAGKKSRPISELELELKSGEAVHLFNLALILLDIVPLEIEHTSKAEYGYSLCSTVHLSVKKSSFSSEINFPDVPSALQSSIGSCLQHLQANLSGTLQHHDEEYLHQMRVGLRRLRVVLAMTATFRADNNLEKLHEQVAKLCIELGYVREWDVFVTQQLTKLRARFPEHAGLLKVMRMSNRKRLQHYAAAKCKLQSQDYQRLLLGLGAWMHGDYWYQPCNDKISLSDFTTFILNKRSLQVTRYGKNLDSASPARLHRVRIACKKLRYTSEIFAAQFNPVKVKSYQSALISLQDILGEMNDIQVTHRLLDNLKQSVKDESIKLIRDNIELDYQNLKIKLSKMWSQFLAQKNFWI